MTKFSNICQALSTKFKFLKLKKKFTKFYFNLEYLHYSSTTWIMWFVIFTFQSFMKFSILSSKFTDFITSHVMWKDSMVLQFWNKKLSKTKVMSVFTFLLTNGSLLKIKKNSWDSLWMSLWPKCISKKWRKNNCLNQHRKSKS